VVERKGVQEEQGAAAAVGVHGESNVGQREMVGVHGVMIAVTLAGR
jgi:hypothetical protein